MDEDLPSGHPVIRCLNKVASNMKEPARRTCAATPSAMQWILTNEPQAIEQLDIRHPWVIKVKLVHTILRMRAEGASHWNLSKTEELSSSQFKH